MTQLETDRFILRPFKEQDIDFLDALHSDEKVMRYILGRTRSHEENLAYLQRLLNLEESHGIGQRIVIRKSDHKPVGRCGISFFYGVEIEGVKDYYFDPKAIPEGMTSTRVFELGYTFHQDVWGKGYATEAASAMRRYALDVQKLPEVHSLIIQENKGSVAVAEKIGAKKIGACLCLGNPAWDYISKAVDEKNKA